MSYTRINKKPMTDFQIVNGEKAYDQPTGGIELTVPLSVPNGYAIAGILSLKIGSGRGALTNYEISGSDLIVYIVNTTGVANPNLTFRCSVLCLPA